MKKKIKKVEDSLDEKINIIEIEAVKLIGKIKGVEGKVELIMDKKTFDDWRNELKEK